MKRKGIKIFSKPERFSWDTAKLYRNRNAYQTNKDLPYSSQILGTIKEASKGVANLFRQGDKSEYVAWEFISPTTKREYYQPAAISICYVGNPLVPTRIVYESYSGYPDIPSFRDHVEPLSFAIINVDGDKISIAGTSGEIGDIQLEDGSIVLKDEGINEEFRISFQMANKIKFGSFSASKHFPKSKITR